MFVARSFRARLLGLAFLRRLPPDCGLLIPRCSSVHTFGMRFALDVVFLDGDGEVLRGPARTWRRGAWRGSGARAAWWSARQAAISPGDIMPSHG